MRRISLFSSPLMEFLPDEILLHLFSYFSAEDLVRVSRINKKSHQVSRDPRLWKPRVYSDYLLRMIVLTTDNTPIRVYHVLPDSLTKLEYAQPLYQIFTLLAKNAALSPFFPALKEDLLKTLDPPVLVELTQRLRLVSINRKTSFQYHFRLERSWLKDKFVPITIFWSNNEFYTYTFLPDVLLMYNFTDYREEEISSFIEILEIMSPLQGRNFDEIKIQVTELARVFGMSTFTMVRR